jgi:hypothetical protein
LIRTHILPCTIPRGRADELNRSSGSIYTAVMVQHWRIYRQGGRHWLSKYAGKFLNCEPTADRSAKRSGEPTTHRLLERP